MNYDEIKALALSYADRKDAEVSNNIDNFLRMVESRANRFLKTMDMSTRSILLMEEGQEYFPLPSDFNGLRDIEIQPVGSIARCTLKYMSPEQLNNEASGSSGSEIYYTLIADQIQLVPTQPAGTTLEIVYYRRLIPLTSISPNNWMSNIHPDCYNAGLMVEISAFVKDAMATELWNNRFSEALDAIQTDDADSRWSGTALQTRVG